MYVYSPTPFDVAPGKHIISNVQRWAIIISKPCCTIKHVLASDNATFDILAKWCRRYREGPKPKDPRAPAGDNIPIQATSNVAIGDHERYVRSDGSEG